LKCNLSIPFCAQFDEKTPNHQDEEPPFSREHSCKLPGYTLVFSQDPGAGEPLGAIRRKNGLKNQKNNQKNLKKFHNSIDSYLLI